MKISASLPGDDVRFLDDYAHKNRIASRSAVLLRAVRLLRASTLGAAYEDAWQEWEESGDPEVWEAAVADGIRA